MISGSRRVEALFPTRTVGMSTVVVDRRRVSKARDHGRLRVVRTPLRTCWRRRLSDGDTASTRPGGLLAYLAGTVTRGGARGRAPDERRRGRGGAAYSEAIRDFRALVRLPLRSSADDAITGTSPTAPRGRSRGLGRALVTLPVPARDADAGWCSRRRGFDTLLDLIQTHLTTGNSIRSPISRSPSCSRDERRVRPRRSWPGSGVAIPRERWGVVHFVGSRALRDAPAGGGRCCSTRTRRAASAATSRARNRCVARSSARTAGSAALCGAAPNLARCRRRGHRRPRLEIRMWATAASNPGWSGPSR